MVDYQIEIGGLEIKKRLLNGAFLKWNNVNYRVT